MPDDSCPVHLEEHGSVDASVSDAAWDGSAGRFSDEQYQAACAACDPEEKGTVKQRCFLPHHEPGGAINRNGVHAAAQRVGHLKGRSPDAVSKAKAHLRSHYGALKEDVPDSLRARPELDRRAKAALLTGWEGRRQRLVPVELREDDGITVLMGYASVTEEPYDMGWWTETIGRGAFAKTLAERPDVQLLINHEGLPLARTTANTLWLDEDERGLKVEANLDPDDPDVARLLPKMRRGDVSEMSFAFRAVKQEWDDDRTERRLTEVNIDRGDVSVVSYGANPATHVGLRAFANSLLELRAGKTLSTDTMATLQQVLDLIAGADDNVDEAQEVLSGLMGVPNPDTPEAPESEPDAAAAAAVLSLELARARASRARSRIIV